MTVVEVVTIQMAVLLREAGARVAVDLGLQQMATGRYRT